MAAEIISVRVTDPNLVPKRKSSQLGLKILKEAEMPSSMNGTNRTESFSFFRASPNDDNDDDEDDDAYSCCGVCYVNARDVEDSELFVHRRHVPGG